MTIPSVSWNENSPAGTDSITLGDNRIREMKTQIREVMDIDHKFASSGQDADNGKHDQVSLLEKADIGTGAEGKPILGAQTVSGKAELLFTDEDDNDVQITSGGKILASSLSTTLAHWSEVFKLIYPVGSIYINASVDTNPATLLGFGTWVAFGTGRVMVGKDSNDTNFDVLEETGGSKTQTITSANLPNHEHSLQMVWGEVDNPNGGTSEIMTHNGSGTTATFPSNFKALTTNNANTPINILQPYIVVCMWKRTA